MRVSIVSALFAVALAGCSPGVDGDRRTPANVDYLTDFVYYAVVYLGDVPDGQVALEQRGDQTRVAITYPSPERFAADLRRGTCDSVNSIGGRTIFVLEPLEDNRSETVVDLSVDDLRNGDYVVVVLDRARPQLMRETQIIACSELGSARRP
jgi:hypothetical protein